MTPPNKSTPCPWCRHEAANDDDFRTHLMVEHRKSELARYVLERQQSTGRSETQEDTESDDDGESDSEPELLAR